MYTPLNRRFTLLILLLAVALTTNAQQLSDRGHLFAKEWKLSKVLVNNDSNRIVELLDENHELGLALRGLGLSATAMDSLILQTISAYVRFQVDSVFLTMGHGTERTSFGMTWRQKGRRMKVFVPDEKPYWFKVSHLSRDQMILTVRLRASGVSRRFKVTLIFKSEAP